MKIKKIEKIAVIVSAVAIALTIISYSVSLFPAMNALEESNWKVRKSIIVSYGNPFVTPRQKMIAEVNQWYSLENRINRAGSPTQIGSFRAQQYEVLERLDVLLADVDVVEGSQDRFDSQGKYVEHEPTPQAVMELLCQPRVENIDNVIHDRVSQSRT